jgi:DNA-binding NarL/FixJ family response regulator
MHVLIIDDDRDDTFFFSEAIKSIDESIQCEVCHEPEDVPKYLALQPDFVFVDNYLGAASGEDIFRNINKHTGDKKPKVVMYSSVFSPTQLKVYNDLGCYGIIKKTASFPEIVAAVRNILKGAKA